MGSDGFESKKPAGAAPTGTAASRLGPNEFSGADRDVAGEAVVGLGGWGFLPCGEGPLDFLVIMETLRRCGRTELHPGEFVLVRFGPGTKGMMAAEIQPETGSPGLSSH